MHIFRVRQSQDASGSKPNPERVKQSYGSTIN